MNHILEKLVGKMVLDAGFHKLLLANPALAVAEAGFKLDKGQFAQLSSGLERYKQDGEAQSLLSNAGKQTSTSQFWL
jgi:hypothetical protein